MDKSPQKNFEVRRLELQHMPQMLALEQACFSMPWNEEQCQKAFSQNHFLALGIFTKSAQVLTETKQYFTQSLQGLPPLVGYVSFYHTLGEGEILNIAVAPKLRRQGLGKILLFKALEWVKNDGLERVVLEVRVSNAPARGLYEKLGFEQVGKRPKYYTNPQEDALIYAMNLG